MVNKNITEVTLSSPINRQFNRLTYVGKADCHCGAAEVCVQAAPLIWRLQQQQQQNLHHVTKEQLLGHH